MSCTRSWWNLITIRHNWPDWIKDEYYVDLAKAKHEKERLRIAAEKDAQGQELASEDKKEYNLVSSVMHDIKLENIIPEQQGNIVLPFLIDSLITQPLVKKGNYVRLRERKKIYNTIFNRCIRDVASNKW